MVCPWNSPASSVHRQGRLPVDRRRSRRHRGGMLRRRAAPEGVHRAHLPVRHHRQTALAKAALPAGDSLTSAAQKPNGGTIRCNLSVDGKLVLSLAQVWWSRGRERPRIRRRTPARHPKTSASSTGGRPASAGTVPSCRTSEHPEQDLCTTVETRYTGIGDPAAIEKLLIACAKAVERSAACRETASGSRSDTNERDTPRSPRPRSHRAGTGVASPRRRASSRTHGLRSLRAVR